jgi:anti-sigma B factor antagonist
LKPFEVVESEPTGRGDYIALALRGYLDAHTVSDFETHMDRSIEQGVVRVLLDLRELNYISSAGIGAIMSTTQRLRRADGDLVLVRPNEKVFAILDKLGFTKIFRLASSVEEGENLLQQS